MKSLKTFAAVCAAALALAACEKENELPTVSFEKSNEVIDSEQEAAVKVVLSQAPAADLTVNFEVVAAGDLKDAYTIGGGDETSLVIKAGETEGTVTVRNNGTSLTTANITLRLASVEGYKSGMNPQIVIALAGNENLIYSFEKTRVRISENSTVSVTVKISGETSGNDFKATGDISIPIAVSEVSTAVENTDYTLSGKEVIIPAGSNSGSFTITATDSFVDAEELPFLTLGLAPASDRFIEGAVSSIEVIFEKSAAIENIVGSWNLTADLLPEDDNLGMLDMVAGELGVAIPFPQVDSTADSFTIGADMKFTPSFSGDLKRYFRECTLSSPVLASFNHPISGKDYECYAITFSSVNFDFGTTDSDLKETRVYVYQPADDLNTLEIFLFCKDGYNGSYEKNYSVHPDFGGDLKYGTAILSEDEYFGALFSLHYRFTRAE